MAQPTAPKRQLRPTTSLPSTAEHYGELHGLDPELQARLQNIGRKGRQAVSQGRSFDRTQSFPTFGSNDMSGFTATQAIVHAESIIQKDEMRRGELRPYASNEGVDALALSPRGGGAGAGARTSSSVAGRSPDRMGRKLTFGADGEVEMDEAVGAALTRGGAGPGASGGKGGESVQMVPGKKRYQEEDEDDVSDTATEVDENEDQDILLLPSDLASPALRSPGAPLGLGGHSSSSGFGSGSMGPPPVPSRFGARAVKAMPGRTLAKTVSAPVRLGGWGMDVDVDEQSGGVGDGFDVSEWAKGEDF
ncbi:hypothetical protein EHS25_006377 [Saitozyma podzolica]|uniref:Uncharacterized protein n=1 Tax=Saitozyma podzolica TaxID=1890683 RepID=A0A427YRQ2_9TREE|nr:hypothetical protein EHS25_006377 [Saitozyma podzolica]